VSFFLSRLETLIGKIIAIFGKWYSALLAFLILQGAPSQMVLKTQVKKDLVSRSSHAMDPLGSAQICLCLMLGSPWELGRVIPASELRAESPQQGQRLGRKPNTHLVL
jgi:hypothetical protein